jgi:predicted flap endonuclease-1-like 5' DNA nuclease
MHTKPGKSNRKLTFWHMLLDLIAVSGVIALFLYWRKRKNQLPVERLLEVPADFEFIYPAETPGQAVCDEAEEASQPAATTPTGEPDDLQRIEGIGPKIASILHESGITTFQQIADRNVEEIKEVLTSSGIRANPSTWAEQAQLAASGEWEKLTQLQSNIKSGRRID